MNFPWCDIILSCEKEWIKNIRDVAPRAEIRDVVVGFNPEHFFEPPADSISNGDRDKLACDISFTGAGYGDVSRRGI